MLDFNQIYLSFNAIKFNAQWKNGTGYFDKAVKGEHAPFLRVAEVVTFEDDKSRKGFIVGTPAGNVVIFQRYSNGSNDVWVINATPKAETFMGPDYSSGFNEEMALKLVGYYSAWGTIINDYNIGYRISEFMSR